VKSGIHKILTRCFNSTTIIHFTQF